MTVDLDVIILAQGQQSRLPKLGYPKQLLALPSCSDMWILGRTLHQVAALVGARAEVTIVCGHEIRSHLGRFRASIYGRQGIAINLHAHELADPGNSSLKGISRFLTERIEPTPARNKAILLGDVVYSWHVLSEILDAACGGDDGGARFVGTPDLSMSGGELWGIGYPQGASRAMDDFLAMALGKHPPFDNTYQPGQLRRWLWELDHRFKIPIPTGDGSSLSTEQVAMRSWFLAIDDYTRDIDLPEHVMTLPQLSELARKDDEEHLLRW